MSGQVAIDERVRELVEAHRTELIELIDQALAHEIETLVTERLTATNGRDHDDHENDVLARENSSRAPTTDAARTGTKVCVGPCGRELPASAFDKYRRACKDCRRAEMRERAQARANGGPTTRERGTDTTPRETRPADAEEPPRTDTPGDDPRPVA